jgi:transitional endoplasmic reticulum ATPase
VAEARQRDVGYGIARIDREVGASAGLSTGDVIEIVPQRLSKSLKASLYIFLSYMNTS